MLLLVVGPSSVEKDPSVDPIQSAHWISCMGIIRVKQNVLSVSVCV